MSSMVLVFLLCERSDDVSDDDACNLFVTSDDVFYISDISK